MTKIITLELMSKKGNGIQREEEIELYDEDVARYKDEMREKYSSLDKKGLLEFRTYYIEGEKHDCLNCKHLEEDWREDIYSGREDYNSARWKCCTIKNVFTSEDGTGRYKECKHYMQIKDLTLFDFLGGKNVQS